MAKLAVQPGADSTVLRIGECVPPRRHGDAVERRAAPDIAVPLLMKMPRVVGGRGSRRHRQLSRWSR